MWQDCSLTAVQRKAAFVEQSWWPELNMFGSMPWCSFPWQKLLGGAKDLLYSLNLIHEFISRRSFLQVCPGKPSHGSRPLWTSVFFCVWASNGKDSPKASPRVIFKWKNFIEQLKLLLKWMPIGRWRRPSMLSSMCQHVARLQFDSCAEKGSLCGTVVMAWIWHVCINAIVLVPTVKAPPKAGSKELSCLNLAYSRQHPCFGPNWFIQFCHTWRW